LGLFYVFYLPQIYKIFSTGTTKNSINYKHPTSTPVSLQATPPLRTIRLFFGVAIFLHWVGRFLVSCSCFPFLCCFGFGAWVVGSWLGSCTGSGGGGWVGFLISFVCLVGEYFVATFGIINLTL